MRQVHTAAIHDQPTQVLGVRHQREKEEACTARPQKTREPRDSTHPLGMAETVANEPTFQRGPRQPRTTTDTLNHYFDGDLLAVPRPGESPSPSREGLHECAHLRTSYTSKRRAA